MLDKNNIPQHVAIIMDGNGRWAKERGLVRSAGHRQGVSRIKEIVRAADKLGIRVITFFAFSTENWDRPRREVDMLMRYLNNFLEREVADLHKNNVRFIRIGLDEPLPQYLRQKIKEAELKTRNNTGLTAVLALNYGSRQEIVEAARRFASCVCAGKAKIEGLNTQNFSDYFYTCGLPDPDLLIRTSGEMRLSNFLLWQLSYAELYFPRKYWPDFRAKDLEEAVKEFQQRERRFGGIESVKKDN